MKNLLDSLKSFGIEYGMKNGYKSHQVTANGMGQPIRIKFTKADGSFDVFPISFRGKRFTERGIVGKYYKEVSIQFNAELNQFQITTKGEPMAEYVVERYYRKYDGTRENY